MITIDNYGSGCPLVRPLVHNNIVSRRRRQISFPCRGMSDTPDERSRSYDDEIPTKLRYQHLLIRRIATAAVNSPNILILPNTNTSNKLLHVSLVVLTQNCFKDTAAPVTEVPSTWSEQPCKPQQYFTRKRPLWMNNTTRCCSSR